MIRRNVVAGGGGVAGPNSPDSGGQQRSTAAASASGSRSGALSSSSHLHSRPRQQRSLTDIAVAFLLMASAVLTILSFMFPAAQQAVVREVEHEGVVVQEMLQKAEDELMQKYWHAHHEAVHAAIPPKTIEQQQLERQQQEKNGPHHEDAYDAEQAALSDRRMQQQTDGSWVAGEKKLKQKLKLLADRQAQGLDLGVPVLTRWLGDDIPAWPSMDESNPMPTDEWQRRVDEKYAQMRLDEEAWRLRMAELIKNVNHG